MKKQYKTKSSRLAKEKLPLEAFLYQCDCSEDNRFGYIFKTLKEAQCGACKECLIQKVKISSLKVKIPK